MAGPCSSSASPQPGRHAVARHVGQVGAGLLRGVGTPAARSTALPGAQIPPPERAVEPPNDPVFSSTTTLSPRCAAVSAAVIPAAPLPATTTSNSAWSVVMPPPARSILEHVTVLAERRSGRPMPPPVPPDLGRRGRCGRGGVRGRGRLRRPGGRAAAGARRDRSTGSAAAGPPRCPAAWSTPAAAPRSSARRVSPTRPRRCSATCAPEVGDAVSPEPTLAGVLRRQPWPCWPGWRATACRSRAACARTRLPTPPTGTTSTTPAASCPPLRSRRALPPPPFPAGTGPPPAARPPDPGPRHLRRAAVRPPVRRRPGAGSRAHPDHRPPAGDRPGRPGDRGGVPDAARRARLGRAAHRVLHRWSARPYLYAPKLGRILHRPVAWLEHRHAARCGSRPRAAWCWPPAGSPPTGR